MLLQVMTGHLQQLGPQNKLTWATRETASYTYPSLGSSRASSALSDSYITACNRLSDI